MRHYVVETGTRFDMNHPLWKQHMVTKEGKPRKKISWEIARDMEAKGILTLVPSVTEIAKGADAFGAFGAGAGWGRDMTIAALQDVLKQDAPWTHETVEKLARANMNKPRDVGSELHESFDHIKTGRLKYDKATAEQQAFYAACEVLIAELGLKEYRTEVEFANHEYGGTADLDSGSKGIDWKTVAKPRPVRPAEVIQVSAYARHFDWGEAWLAHYDQSTRKFLEPVWLGDSDIEAGYEAFQALLKSFHAIRGVSV